MGSKRGCERGVGSKSRRELRIRTADPSAPTVHQRSGACVWGSQGAAPDSGGSGLVLVLCRHKEGGGGIEPESRGGGGAEAGWRGC